MMWLIMATVWAGFAIHDYLYGYDESCVIELILALINVFLLIIGY